MGRFVAELAARFGPPPPVADVEARRDRMEAVARAVSPRSSEGLEVENTFIALLGREVPLRLYRPLGTPKGSAILHIHGGGWVLGSLDSHHAFAADLARETGAVVVAVHYRRAPENSYPAPLEDCREALRWMRRHAGRLGIDPQRMAIAGDSAGAHLAIGCALSDLQDGAGALAGLGLLYPVIEPDFDRASYVEFAEGPGLTRDEMRFFWGAFLPGEADDVAIPSRSAALAGLPPTYLVTAELDPLRDEGESFAAQLAAAGVAVEAHRAPGLLHGFFRAMRFSDAVRHEADRLFSSLRKL